MLLYCLKCRLKSDSKNSRVAETKKGKLIILSKCGVRDNKKLRFIKEQDTSRLLCSLGIKTPLNEIPLVGTLLF